MGRNRLLVSVGGAFALADDEGKQRQEKQDADPIEQDFAAAFALGQNLMARAAIGAALARYGPA